ncbi:hypothetical protein HELRODRAFT_169119 [Helobdella robusta]|uniref:Uncharacterized protein n=1 Tax=Helobdella robusta TaxID=6412 RepID=T1F1F5_HELRO|nr:hypothetical protein HELRODRAFT_169119 [Helobdella robusta]ESO08314.1 hypothetical protein HELRODRAFT_169119 [Helobdella robusta]
MVVSVKIVLQVSLDIRNNKRRAVVFVLKLYIVSRHMLRLEMCGSTIRSQLNLDAKGKMKVGGRDDEVFCKVKLEALEIDMKFLQIENRKLRNQIRMLQRVNIEKLKCQEKLDMAKKHCLEVF